MPDLNISVLKIAEHDRKINWCTAEKKFLFFFNSYCLVKSSDILHTVLKTLFWQLQWLLLKGYGYLSVSIAQEDLQTLMVTESVVVCTWSALKQDFSVCRWLGATMRRFLIIVSKNSLKCGVFSFSWSAQICWIISKTLKCQSRKSRWINFNSF